MTTAATGLLQDPTSRRALALAVAVDATVLGEEPQALDVLRAIVRDARAQDPLHDALWSLSKRIEAKLTADYGMLPKQAEALTKIGLQRIAPVIAGAALDTQQVALAADFAARAIAWCADPHLMQRHESLLTRISREITAPGGAAKWAGTVNETHVLGHTGYQRSTPLLAVRILKGQLGAQPQAQAAAKAVAPAVAAPTPTPPPSPAAPAAAPAARAPAVQPQGMKRLMDGMQDVKNAMAGGRKRPTFRSPERDVGTESTPTAQPPRASR